MTNGCRKRLLLLRILSRHTRQSNWTWIFHVHLQSAWLPNRIDHTRRGTDKILCRLNGHDAVCAYCHPKKYYYCIRDAVKGATTKAAISLQWFDALLLNFSRLCMAVVAFVSCSCTFLFWVCLCVFVSTTLCLKQTFVRSYTKYFFIKLTNTMQFC